MNDGRAVAETPSPPRPEARQDDHKMLDFSKSQIREDEIPLPQGGRRPVAQVTFDAILKPRPNVSPDKKITALIILGQKTADDDLRLLKNYNGGFMYIDTFATDSAPEARENNAFINPLIALKKMNPAVAAQIEKDYPDEVVFKSYPDDRWPRGVGELSGLSSSGYDAKGRVRGEQYKKITAISDAFFAELRVAAAITQKENTGPNVKTVEAGQTVPDSVHEESMESVRTRLEVEKKHVASNSPDTVTIARKSDVASGESRPGLLGWLTKFGKSK